MQFKNINKQTLYHIDSVIQKKNFKIRLKIVSSRIFYKILAIFLHFYSNGSFPVKSSF